MSPLSQADLHALIETPDGACVSLFMPVETAGPDVQQGPIRLKNLLDEAEERLIVTRMRSPEARRLLEPMRDLITQSLFWQHQQGGLALYASDERLHILRLPLRLSERVMVGERFYLKPLMPLLSGDGEFYILAISQKQIRLLEATRDRVAEVDLENVPESLAEALRFDDREKQLQWHTRTDTFAARGRQAMFHGHGATAADVAKDDILRYFQKVNQGISEYLAGSQAPLLLAGVDYLLPIYQEANDYPHLLEEGITGNPDNLRAEELHREAWQIMAPLFQREREEWAERYLELAGRGDHLASDSLKMIVAAASYGQVATLFVALDRERWGRFDLATGKVEIHDEPEPGDQELLDLAAVNTWLNSGRIYAVSSEEMPGEGEAAAVLRY